MNNENDWKDGDLLASDYADNLILVYKCIIWDYYHDIFEAYIGVQENSVTEVKSEWTIKLWRKANKEETKKFYKWLAKNNKVWDSKNKKLLEVKRM